jgi:hypothetical protein
VLRRRNRKRTRVLVIRELEKDLGLVKFMMERIMREKRALVRVEITAAAICRPFYTYSFLNISTQSS